MFIKLISYHISVHMKVSSVHTYTRKVLYKCPREAALKEGVQIKQVLLYS